MRVAACVLTVLAVIASLSTIATALHEDQKGKLDWSRSGVGQAKFVSFHPKSANLKSVYVASWSGVVASFGLSKGEIRWRQVFGRNESIQCLEVTPHAVFVALSGSQVLNVFDPKTGVVKRSFPLTHAPVGCGQVDGKVHLVTAGPHVTVVTEDAIKTLEKLSFEPLRDATAASPVKSALVATDGTIGVYFEDGTLQEWGKINESPHLTRDVSDASVPSCSTLKHNLACPSQAHFALGSCKTLFTVEKDLKLKELSKDVVALSCDPTGLQIKVSPTGFVTLQDNRGGVYDTLLRERPGTRPKLLAFRDEAQRSEIVVTTSGGAIQYLKVKSTDSSLDVLNSWTVEEGLSEIDQAVFPHARGSVQEDHTSRVYKFGTNDRMILASRHGMLFSLLSNDGRDKPEWKAFAAADAAIHYDVVRGKCFQLLSLQVIDDVVSVRLRFRDADQTVVQLSYSVYTGELLSQAAAPSKKSQIFLPDGTTVAESGTVTQPFSQQRDYLVVNKTTGHIQGFVIPSNATTSTPSWTVSLGAPIVASDSGSNDLRKVLTTEHLRFIPNATTSANDVRRKYLTANTLVTCHFQPLNAEDEDEQDGTSSTLIVTAIDTISGQVIGRMRHDHVEGEVRVTVVENMVVYHFLSTVTMRHYLGVWELFEHQDVPVQDSQFTSPALVAMSFFEKRRTFSGIVARPPQIMTQVLAFPLGSVEGLGVTVSGLHVARKNIIITTTTGHVLMVPMSELRTGFQYPVTPNGPPPPRTLLVPSTNIISHQLTIHRGSRVFTAPTPLESTSHVLVAGLDLFYTRVSSGKPFDVIDDEFNYLALTIVCLALPLIAVVMRTVANRRRLSAEWA